MSNKEFLLAIFLVLLGINSWSQGESNIWYFGQYAGIDFNGIEPVALTNSAMNQSEGCSVMSDANGNLLFYTDGQTIWNKFHAIMPNGSDLMGHSSASQSVIIVPKPTDDNKYYVFTVDAKNNNLENGLRYTIVDMQLDNGKGDVEPANKNVHLFTKVAEKLTAAKHANGEDIWIIVHQWGSRNFLSFKVTADEVELTPVISTTVTSIGNSYSNAIGSIKVSPNNDYLASTTSNLDLIELFHFNNSTGEISEFVILDDYEDASGIEFSPDNSKLYVSGSSGSDENELFQFDISSADPLTIANSEFLVYQSETDINDLQLAPDGKIYAAKYFKPYLGRINSPNESGIACDYADSSFYLEGRNCQLGLPDFILVVRGFVSPYTCFGDTNQFTLYGVVGDYVPRWVFGDGDTSYLTNPAHYYENPGIYLVEVLVTLEDTSYIFEKKITVHALPDVNLGPDTAICEGTQIELETNGSFESYEWQDGSTMPTFITGTPGFYSLKVIDINGCINSDNINISLNNISVLDIGPDTAICSGEKVILDVGEDYTDILWSDGTKEQTKETGEEGKVSVIVTDTNGCIAGDSLMIELLYAPQVNLGNDTTICEGITIELNAGISDGDYLWWDGSTGQTNFVSDSGFYWINVSNQCGIVESSVQISTKDCNPDIYFPNAFTPNSDGINDLFAPVSRSSEFYDSRMMIFNRFGQLVYEADNMILGWDGNKKGQACPPGTYIWKISYKIYEDGINLTEKLETGYITLLR